jgi:hypothetical protein
MRKHTTTAVRFTLAALLGTAATIVLQILGGADHPVPRSGPHA